MGIQNSFVSLTFSQISEFQQKGEKKTQQGSGCSKILIIQSINNIKPYLQQNKNFLANKWHMETYQSVTKII